MSLKSAAVVAKKLPVDDKITDWCQTNMSAGFYM